MLFQKNILRTELKKQKIRLSPEEREIVMGG